MPNTTYASLSEINGLQTDIMRFIDSWVHQKKTPTPLKEIMIYTIGTGIKKPTTVKAISSLLQKGYIRRTINGGGNSKTAFVQLRRI